MRKTAFIGVGNMAGAIIGGMLRAGITDAGHLLLYDLLPERVAPYAEAGARTPGSAAEAAAEADCVVLAVKPQNFPEVLPLLAEAPGIASKLVITIAAGIPSAAVRSALRGAPVVRVLPNTPMLIGMGVSAVCRADGVSPDDFAYARSLFEASGRVIVIDEGEMNRMISVTSSSPAYVFAFIRAILDGARAQGIESEDLLGCVCDMVIGSAALLKTGGLSPAEQIRRVTSKGGTTERALRVLEARGMEGIIADAMRACTARAEELGGGGRDGHR